MLSIHLWNYFIEKTDINGKLRIYESPVYENVRSAFKNCIYFNKVNNENAHFEIKQEPIHRSYDFDIIEVLKAE